MSDMTLKEASDWLKKRAEIADRSKADYYGERFFDWHDHVRYRRCAELLAQWDDEQIEAMEEYEGE